MSHVRPDDGQIGADIQLKEALTALNVGKSSQRHSQQNTESKIHHACHISFFFYLMVLLFNSVYILDAYRQLLGSYTVTFNLIF